MNYYLYEWMIFSYIKITNYICFNDGDANTIFFYLFALKHYVKIMKIIIGVMTRSNS